MTFRRLGVPIVALAGAIFAGSVFLAPIAGASSETSGSTRQISASGTTSFNPAASAGDVGIEQPELGPGQAGLALRGQQRDEQPADRQQGQDQQ